MMTLWGRIKCKLGFHDPVHIIFNFGEWDECYRCGKGL